MKSSNIFILSVGRRVELVECFSTASKALGINSKIIGGDCDPLAPAGYFSDKFVILPRISDVTYIDEIIKVSNENRVTLIIPTIDTDLQILSDNRAYIEKETNARVLISDSNVIKICRDKISTHDFMEKNGFLVPKIYSLPEIEEGNLRFPLFIKPKSGSSSIDAYKVETMNSLKKYYREIKDPIVQDFLDGAEYTIDVFLDFESNIISVTPRLRVATRSGEISKGKIVKNVKIIDEVKKMINILKPIGHITVQVIETQRGVEFIEINPRFGGGAPMSIMSGSNSCEYLYELMQGKKLKYREEFRENITYLRFDKSICIDESFTVVHD